MARYTIILIALFFASTTVFAEEHIDLDLLTRQCAAASKQFRKIRKAVAYKVLHTVEYTGWSGNPACFNLKDPIAMTITFAGNDRRGAYWFPNKPEVKVNIHARTDFDGNIELIEIPADYRFKGRMENGVIKGIWKNSTGNKSFAFCVKAKESPIGKPIMP